MPIEPLQPKPNLAQPTEPEVRPIDLTQATITPLSAEIRPASAPLATGLKLDELLALSEKAGTSRLTPETFARFAQALSGSIDEKAALFDRLDVDGDGAITRLDDLNGDGLIDQRDAALMGAPDTKREKYGKSTAAGSVAKELQAIEAIELAGKSAAIRAERTNIGRGLALYRYDVPVFNLPAELEGTTILHLSDIHFSLGSARTKDALTRLANNLPTPPDIVILTGDIIEYSLIDLDPDAIETLKTLFPNSLKLAVPGNHDLTHAPRGAVMRLLESAGFIDLTNKNLRILIDGAPLNLCGVDDALAGNPELPQLSGGERFETRILATHNLDALTNDSSRGIDLVLSGHLHAGEINLGIIDGVDFLKYKGAYRELNEQRKGWKHLTWRTLSYISPGLTSHMFRFNTEKAGGTLHTLKRFDRQDKGYNASRSLPSNPDTSPN